MRSTTDSRLQSASQSLTPYLGRVAHWFLFALFVAFAPMPVATQSTLQTTPHSQRADRTVFCSPRPMSPDANDQMEMREQQVKKQDFSAANIERKKQISDDSAKLLKLAADLKSEVDKTTKDTLSINVIRKADEIEKLAHSVKEKMKLTIGAT